MVQGTWKRPFHALVYDMNYKYGSSLYSHSISQIGRRYAKSVARSRTGHSLDTDLQLLRPVLSRDLYRPVRSLSDIDSYFLLGLPKGRRYRQLMIADPFNIEEEARAHRRRRRRQRLLLDDDLLQYNTTTTTIPEYHWPIGGSSFLPSFHLAHLWDSTSSFSPISYSPDFSLLIGKCLRLQDVLHKASHRMSDAEAKLKGEPVISVPKGRYDLKVAELEADLQARERDNAELRKVVKSQIRQIEEMQSLQDDWHRHWGLAQDGVIDWQRRYKDLQFHLDTPWHSCFA